MMFRNSDERYGLIAQAFHWVVAVLVFVQLVVGTIAADLPFGLDRLILLSRHKSIGVTIFALVVLRLAWRWSSPAPQLPRRMPPAERRLAQLTHGSFYVLLLCMPVAGWLQSSASNLTVSWFGVLPLPDLIGPDQRLADIFAASHRAMAWILLALVCLHVMAALRHQLILRDDILGRMLPKVRRAQTRKRTR